MTHSCGCGEGEDFRMNEDADIEDENDGVGEDEDNKMDESDDKNSSEIVGSTGRETMDYMIGSRIITLWLINYYTDFLFLL